MDTLSRSKKWQGEGKGWVRNEEVYALFYTNKNTKLIWNAY